MNIVVSVWFGLSDRGRVEVAIHRQDDRIRKRIERTAQDDDEEHIKELLDKVRTEYEDGLDDVLARHPLARRPDEL